MKRTQWVRKQTVPMKRGKLRKKSKESISKLQRQIWQECRRIIKARYVLPDGTYKCFTCDKPIEGSNCQLGHFIPSSVGGALLRYNLNNLRLQCYYDNINLGGNGSEFYRRMVAENGKEFVENLFTLKHQTTKAYEHYTKILKDMSVMDVR